jgi:ABC-2 type transport system permease protein
LTVVASVFLHDGTLLNVLLHNPNHASMLLRIVGWATDVTSFFPLIIGVLLADRLPRDRHTRIDEVLQTLPAPLNARLFGKYLGTTLASLILMVVLYCLGLGLLLSATGNALVFPLGLGIFAAIALPGVLFISAFSLACPAFIWTPVYQFLLVGYWFWGNLFSPTNGIPTLSPTILTPAGGYMAIGFFGDTPVFQVQKATFLQGVESMGVLLAVSVLVLFALWYLLQRQQRCQ